MQRMVDRLVEDLVGSGLVPPDELRDIRSTLDAGEAEDPARLIEALVKSGRLTGFQAEELKHGRAKGLVLGNYVLLDRIGQGGMGQVFKVEHRRMKRIAALKVLPSSL